MAAAARAQLEDYDGILVPGGFGKRGIEGMLNAIRYARERKVPYFGICLGMQTMVIEFARNVCGLERRRLHRVRSRHAAPRDLQAARAEGRRRAGRHHAPGRLALPAGRRQLRARTPTAAREISERHRHRYEFNREYEERPEGARACGSPARRPTARTSRSARSPTTLVSWAASSIPSSSRSRWSRIRCSSAFIGAAYEYRAAARWRSRAPLLEPPGTRVPIEFSRDSVRRRRRWR